MRSLFFIACLLFAAGMCTSLDAAAKKFGLTFKSTKELKLLRGIGSKVTLNTKNSTKKGSGSVALEPGATIEMPLFKKKDGIGNISVKFFDDLKSPADSTKTRRGPSFGLRNKDGYELSVGIMYASFIDGAAYYYINHYRYSDKSQTPTKFVKHIKVKRVKGWNEFAFEFDPRKGLIIKINGKDINHGLGQNPFKWQELKFASFDKVIFHGDVKDAEGQTAYIDDILVTLNKEGTALKLQ